MGTGTLGQVRASRSYFGAPVGRGAVLPRPSADLAARQSVSRQHFFLIDTHPHASHRRLALRLGDVLEVLEVLLQQLVHRGDVVLELGVHLLEL